MIANHATDRRRRGAAYPGSTVAGVVFAVLQLSDPHLSAARAYGLANFGHVVAEAHRMRPDLVVVTGDLALDDPDDAEDREFAHRCLQALPGPYRVLPGNHDIGDTEPDPWMDQPVSSVRRQRWVELWGPDWWVEEAEGWVLIGLDSLLFGSGLPAEEEQWEWLRGVVGAAGRRPVAVFLHKPLCLWYLDENVITQRAVTPAGRRRLRQALGEAEVRLVASGHVHQYRSWASEGITMVWAPSTAFVSRSAAPSAYGAAKTVGTVLYRFWPDGVAWELVRPDGMVDADVHRFSRGAGSLRDAPRLPVAWDPAELPEGRR